jgi:hypothetical protein
MNDLNALLERAAGPAVAPVDAHADLARGRGALTRTRRRRRALGLAGVATAGVVGLGLGRLADRDGDVAADHGPDHRTSSHRADVGVPLLAQPFTAGPYVFDQTPQGWEVQGAYPQGVTIAPVGFPDQQPLSFTGKLVIMLDTNPVGDGDPVELDGRTFVVRRSDGDYTLVSTRTRPGEPAGVLRIQYPSSTGWSRDTMVAFLAGVRVGTGAQPGLG